MPQDPKALTREQMEDVIRRGGSVCHKGQIIHKIEELPSVDSLVGSEEERQSELDKLRQEEADLAKRREALEAKSFTKKVDESDPKEEDEFTKLAAKADAEKAAEDKGGKKK